MLRVKYMDLSGVSCVLCSTMLNQNLSVGLYCREHDGDEVLAHCVCAEYAGHMKKVAIVTHWA